MSTTTGAEEINKDGGVEIKEDTVDAADYRTPPGQEDKEPKKEGVHVVHLSRKKPESAAAVQSAKEAMSGGGKDSKTKE